MLKRFAGDRRGVTAVEYGLIVCVISLAMLGGFSLTGNALVALFTDQATIVDQSGN